jgi:hypothetical protein
MRGLLQFPTTTIEPQRTRRNTEDYSITVQFLAVAVLRVLCVLCGSKEQHETAEDAEDAKEC